MHVPAVRVLQVAALAACAAVLWGATPPSTSDSAPSLPSAYVGGQLVNFNLAPAGKGQPPFSVGPWQFGARVADRKPRDHRLNLYLVSPGTQLHAAGREEFDHNQVLSALPPEGGVVEWDVYWAIVLDPDLREDLRSEQDLIVHAQEGFVPGDLFEFKDVPGRGFLRAFLEVDSLEGLEPYRLQDGQLPRLIIVPAGFAVRASAMPVEPPRDQAPTAAKK